MTWSQVNGAAACGCGGPERTLRERCWPWDLNTAILRPVDTGYQGLNPEHCAEHVVVYSESARCLRSRRELLKVAAWVTDLLNKPHGLLRVMKWQPITGRFQAVHPEGHIRWLSVLPARRRGYSQPGSVIRRFLRQLEPSRYTDEHFGIPTITDILQGIDQNPPVTHVRSSRPRPSRKARSRAFADLRPWYAVWTSGRQQCCEPLECLC